MSDLPGACTDREAHPGASDFWRGKARAEADALLRLAPLGAAPPILATAHCASVIDGALKLGAIVLPFSSAPDLFGVVEQTPQSVFATNANLARRLIRRLLQVLSAAHSVGHVHGDLRLEQCLLDTWTARRRSDSGASTFACSQPSDAHVTAALRGGSSPRALGIAQAVDFPAAPLAQHQLQRSSSARRAHEASGSSAAPILGDGIESHWPNLTFPEACSGPSLGWQRYVSPEDLVLTDWSAGPAGPPRADGALMVALESLCVGVHAAPEVQLAASTLRRSWQDEAVAKERAAEAAGELQGGPHTTASAAAHSDSGWSADQFGQEEHDGAAALLDGDLSVDSILPSGDSHSERSQSGGAAAAASSPAACTEALTLGRVDGRKVDSFGVGVVAAYLLTRRGVHVNIEDCATAYDATALSDCPGAASFIEALTCWSPASRLTADEALCHPFLKRC